MSKNLEISKLLDFYSVLLTDKQREIAEYYYNDDLSLGEIAENLDISRQGVRDSIKRSETILFEAEEKLSLIEKSEILKNSLEAIKRNITAISVENEMYNNSAISHSTEKILNELEKLNEI